MLRKWTYKYIQPVLDATCRLISRSGLNAYHLSYIGLGINVMACLIFIAGWFAFGGWVVLFAGLFDMLDGAFARYTKSTSDFGAFFDSVIDRYSDFLIFGGVMFHYMINGEKGLAFLVFVVITGAILTSYTKARAESLIERCDVGFVERPERILILCAGALTGMMVPALIVLAVTTHATAAQRILFTYRKCQKPDSSGRRPEAL